MAELCISCGEKITTGGLLGNPNAYLEPSDVRILNFVHGSDHESLCQKCGGQLRFDAFSVMTNEADQLKRFLEGSIADFPMMTISVLPVGASFRVLGMVTANVTVGTGLFNEFSQGVSDMFGAVNSQSGMAHKVNKGEGAARGILVQKAMQMGANCIIGVDVDYGTTNNNGATVNMQGTAVHVADLGQVLSESGCRIAEQIAAAWQRLKDLQRWLTGKIEHGERYA